ncbi:MAG: TonB family protein [Acidobacteriota bacterium]
MLSPSARLEPGVRYQLVFDGMRDAGIQPPSWRTASRDDREAPAWCPEVSATTGIRDVYGEDIGADVDLRKLPEDGSLRAVVSVEPGVSGGPAGRFSAPVADGHVNLDWSAACRGLHALAPGSDQRAWVSLVDVAGNSVQAPFPISIAVASLPPGTEVTTRVLGAVRPSATFSSPGMPAIARKAGVQGTVRVELTVDVDGSVVEGHVLRSVPLLDAASLAALQKWTFEPADGAGTRCVQVDVEFVIRRQELVSVPICGVSTAVKPWWRRIFARKR